MAKVAEATVKLSLDDKLTTPLKRIQKNFKALSNNLGFTRIAASTKNLTKSLRGLNKGFSQTMGRVSKLTALLGLGGGGLAASMYGLSKNTAQTAMELGDTAKQLGLGVVPLQLWQHAAERSGLGAEKFNSALAQLNKKSAEAAQGSKSAAAAFSELGISVKNSSGQLKNSDELMQEVTTSMGKIGNHGARQRLAAQLFGGDGREMAAMLSGGMSPIDELFKEKRGFGDLIGQDVVDSGGGFMASLGELQGHLNGIKTTLAVHLMPVVHEIITAIKDWIIENKELIKTGIEKWVGRLRQVITDLQNPASELRLWIDGWITSFQNFYAIIQPVVDFLGGPLNTALIGLAAFIAGPLIIALAAAGKAFIALGLTIMATPIGWIVAGIAAVVAAGYYLWKNWDKIKQWWFDLWDGMIETVKNWPIVRHLIAAWGAVSDWWAGVKEWWANVSLVDEGWNLILSLRDGIVNAFWGIIDFFKNIGSNIWEAVKEAGSNILEIGGNIIDWIWEGIKSGWESVKAWFRDAVDNLTSWLPDWVREGMGFEVNVSPNLEGMEAVNGTVNHSVEAMQAINNPYDIPELRPREAADARAIRLWQESQQAEKMQAEQLQVQNFEIPEPITVHKPTEIDTSVTIQNLTVQSSGTVRRAITRAMAGISHQQSSNVNAALND